VEKAAKAFAPEPEAPMNEITLLDLSLAAALALAWYCWYQWRKTLKIAKELAFMLEESTHGPRA